MSNSTTEFLKYFSKIENHLEKMPKVNGRASFAQMVREASKHSYVIRREREVLDSLRALRNVLVHEAGNVIIAVPSEEAMEAIKRIYRSLDKPKKVYDIVDHQMVTLKAHRNLADALRLMADKDYSQIPVYEGKTFAGLLTGNAIAKWMMVNMDDKDDLVKSLNDVPLTEVLTYCDHRDDLKFIDRHMLVEELMAMIEDRPSTSGVYIITENGRPTEKPLAIATMEDYSLLEGAI